MDIENADAFILILEVIEIIQMCIRDSASTDAPCSALSVIYTENGVFEEYLFLPANPNMVLMDTEVIAKSPARLTVAGMGDALATYFEARAVQAKDALTCAGGRGTLAAHALAKLCFDTLMEEGVKAKVCLLYTSFPGSCVGHPQYWMILMQLPIFSSISSSLV